MTQLREKASEFQSEYDNFILSLAELMYERRQSFFEENFDGYVEDTVYLADHESYSYWPAMREDGWYFGYDTLCEGEKEIADELAAHGFEYLGSGSTRSVFRCPPPYEDLTVKFGRAGIDMYYAEGRYHNLAELRLFETHPDAPLLPCYFVSAHGEYSICPYAEPTYESGNGREDVEEVLDELGNTLPRFKPDSVQDMGELDGEIVCIDYSSAIRYTGNQTICLPMHVNTDEIIRKVNEQRRCGDKMDLIASELRWVQPDIATD